MNTYNNCCILHRAVGSASDCRSRGRKIDSQLGHVTFVEIDHEFYFYGHSPPSAVSVTSESMCASTG